MTQLKAVAPFGRGRATVEIILDGRRVPAKFVGMGKFTSAYRPVGQYDHVVLYSAHGDESKRIMADAYHLGKTRRGYNPHLCKVKVVGMVENEWVGDLMVCIAKRFVKPTKQLLTQTNGKILNMLHEAHETATLEFDHDVVESNETRAFNECLIQSEKFPASIRYALNALVEAASDVGGHYLFDNFRVDNMGLDHKGRLVFIDPMFKLDTLVEHYDKYGTV